MSTRVAGFRYTNGGRWCPGVDNRADFCPGTCTGRSPSGMVPSRCHDKVMLPDEGLFGLTEGAQVDILGTKAGEVRRIVLDPNQHMHAEISVSKAMLAFVRRDSRAIIRKQFGVAGASYLELTRGSGEPLDWEYAVLTATADRTPTDTVSELLAEIRSKVIPIRGYAISLSRSRAGSRTVRPWQLRWRLRW
jgi:hypothetical protein